MRAVTADLRDDLVGGRGVHPADQPAIDHGRRRGRAKTEAVDRIKRHAAVGGGLAEVDAELLADAVGDRAPPAAWQASARQSFRTCRPGRLAPKIVIEGHDAVHFGARNVQRFGDDGDGVFRHVADRLLHGVQDRQRRALHVSDVRR